MQQKIHYTEDVKMTDKMFVLKDERRIYPDTVKKYYNILLNKMLFTKIIYTKTSNW